MENKFLDCREWSPTKEILDPYNLEKAIIECLGNNDFSGVLEVIKIYIDTVFLNIKSIIENKKCST